VAAGAGQGSGADAGVARRAQAQARQRGDAQARRHQGLHRHIVIGGEGDLGGEPGEGALPDQVAAAALAAGDPPALRVRGKIRRA